MNYSPAKNAHLHINPDSIDHKMAMTVGCDLNNEAFLADTRGDYKTAVEKYKQAIEIKKKAYGENSVHICVSLSGLCDAYLSMEDAENATLQSKRMMAIAQTLRDKPNRNEQIRIANELLVDCEKLNKKLAKRMTHCGKCDGLSPKYHCGKCNKIKYCSRECQVEDWAKHKPCCNVTPSN